MRGTPLLVVSVASMSDPKTTSYTVTLYKDTAPWCTCAAQRFAVAKRPCKHIRSVLLTTDDEPTRMAVERHVPAPLRAKLVQARTSNEFSKVRVTVPAAILETAEDESFQFEFRGVHRA